MTIPSDIYLKIQIDEDNARSPANSELTGYADLVENVKLLLEVVEAPNLRGGGKIDVIQKERNQYFKAKKAISEIIFKA